MDHVTNNQGDGPANRSHQASPARNTFLRNLTIRSSDHQASTSRGLSDTTQSRSDHLEQRQRSPDQLQKRLNVLLAEWEIYFNEPKEILDAYKQEFQKRASESEQKKYIEDLEKQLEINEKLGGLLKSQQEELIEVRISVLDFMKKKIENESNKIAILKDWSYAIDEYCGKHAIGNVYNIIAQDMMHCYQADRGTIKKLTQNKGDNNYKGPNLKVHEAIKTINESLYTEQEREHLVRDLNHYMRLDLFQDLDHYMRLELYLDLDHQHQLELYQGLNRHERRDIIDALELHQLRELYRDLDHQQQRELYLGLHPRVQRELYLDLSHQQQRDLVQGLDHQKLLELFQSLDRHQRRELVQGLSYQQRLELYLDLDHHQQQRESFSALASEQSSLRHHLDLSYQQQRELVQDLSHQQRQELVQGLNYQQQLELYLDLSHQQRQDLVQGFDRQKLLELFKNLDRHQRRELVQGLNYQQQRELYLALDRQQRLQELYLALDRHQGLQELSSAPVSEQSPRRRHLDPSHQQQRDLFKQQLKRLWESCIPMCCRQPSQQQNREM